MNKNERIKYLRTEILNISQEELGYIIGISKSGVSAIENNTRNVTEKHIKLIANAQDINEDWLRHGTGEIFHSLTKSEELMKYTALLLKDTDSNMAQIIKNLIITYGQLNADNKKTLEEIAIKYIENKKKDQ